MGESTARRRGTKAVGTSVGASGARARPKEERKEEGLWEWVKSGVVALLLFLVIRTFLIQAFTIPSGSMEDTLLIGDYLMANNAVFGATIPFTHVRVPAFRDPEFGDVVVFRPAYNDPVIDVVKRVIGEPGDTVRMEDRVVYRNGERLEEPYIEPDFLPDEPLPAAGFANYRWHLDALTEDVDPRSYRPTRDTWGPLVVPQGNFLLLGDNRDQSLDSRFMGFIPREVIRGKAMFIYFSKAPGGGIDAIRWDRFGRVIR